MDYKNPEPGPKELRMQLRRLEDKIQLAQAEVEQQLGAFRAASKNLAWLTRNHKRRQDKLHACCGETAADLAEEWSETLRLCGIDGENIIATQDALFQRMLDSLKLK